jgi:mRNA interferase MazF|tara:strand:+ start:3193 stop:3504 length:312 start_codon:yes stop_codon:yes gene_type:complete
MFNSGDIVLTKIQYTDTGEVKTRPALILFEELGNVIVAGITSNLNMKGVSLTKKEGMIKDSIIKLNYIFTISNQFISKKLFSLNSKKKKEVFEQLTKRLNSLN